MDTRTAQALIRFGLGRRGEEPLPPDPASWLHDQLRQPDPTLLDPRPSTATGLEALHFDRRNKPPEGQRAVPPLFRDQSRAELANALTTSAPFRERLVWFWTNHFTVSVRGGCAAVACAFVEEAIRPPRHRPVRDHAAGGDAPPGDADLPEQRRSRSAPTAWPASAATAA